MGNNGVQLPVKEYQAGQLLGTEMLYADHRFDTPDGKARFLRARSNGLPQIVEAQRASYRFLVNNGRTNHIWQTAYHDRHLAFRRDASRCRPAR